MNYQGPGGVAWWRIVTAGAILAVLIILAAKLLPIYLDNLALQRYVQEVTQKPGNQDKPDGMLRVAVLEKAASLGLPVRSADVRIRRPNNRLQIDARYVVRVDLLFYTVDLHFYPGAGSK